MPIRLQGPDGVINEFPDGTPDWTVEASMRSAYGGHPDADTDALVRTVWGEARNQKPEGQQAVASVVLNRAAQVGQTPTQIVQAHGQFEPWQNPQTRKQLESLDPDSPEYQQILANIAPALMGHDPTNGADHFYAPKAQAALGRPAPAWADAPDAAPHHTATIGDHEFYKYGYRPHAAKPSIADQIAAIPGSAGRWLNDTLPGAPLQDTDPLSQESGFDRFSGLVEHGLLDMGSRALKGAGALADTVNRQMLSKDGVSAFGIPSGAMSTIADEQAAPIDKQIARLPAARTQGEQLISGGAGMAPMLIAPESAPFIFGAQGAGEQADKAAQLGLSGTPAADRAVMEGAGIQGGLGAMQADAILGKYAGKAFDSLPAAVKNRVTKALTAAGVTGAAGAGIGAGFQGGSNLTTKLNLDPNQDLGQGVGDAAVQNTILALGLHGMHAAPGAVADLMAPRVARETPPAPPMPSTNALDAYAGQFPEGPAPEPSVPFAAAAARGLDAYHTAVDAENDVHAQTAMQAVAQIKSRAKARKALIQAAHDEALTKLEQEMAANAVPPSPGRGAEAAQAPVEPVATPEAVQVQPQPQAAPEQAYVPDHNDAAIDMIRAGKMPKLDQGPSLLQFLRSQGKLAPDGELKAMNAPLNLIRKGGLSLEAAAHLARDAGYFPEATIPTMDSSDNMHPVTEQHIIDAIRDELAGKKRYAQEAPQEQVAAAQHVADMQEIIHHLGLDPERMTNTEIKARVADFLANPDVHPDEQAPDEHGYGARPPEPDQSYYDEMEREAAKVGVQFQRPAKPESEPTLLANGPAEQTLIPGVKPVDENVRRMAELIRSRNARRGAREMPQGGLFDEVARAQSDLFSQDNSAPRNAPEQLSDQSGQLPPKGQGSLFSRSEAGDGAEVPEGSVRQAEGLVGVPAERGGAHEQIIDHVQRLLTRLAPHAESRPMESLTATGEHAGPVSGAAWRSKTGHVIAWALDAADAVGAARHEALHALRQAGLIGDHEWKALTDASHANGWIAKHDVAKRYPDLTPEQHHEEAIAEEFGKWRRSTAELQGKAPSLVQRVFRRLDLAMRQISAAVRKGLGRSPTASDVMALMESGAIGKRAQRAPGEAAEGVQFAKRPRPTLGLPAKRPGNALDRIAGKFPDDFGAKLKATADRFMSDTGKEIGDSVRMGLNPMAAGGDVEQAAAKRFANALRATDYQFDKLDAWLQKAFTREQRQRMAIAMDEHGVLIRQGIKPGRDQGLNRLAPDERAAVEELNRRQDETYKQARALGIHDNEGLEWHYPRMAAGKDGARITSATPKQAAAGGNLTTTTGQMRQRKYETMAETDAAMKRAFGPDAHVVTDIRTVGLATRNLQRAIAGKVLVEKIKDVGKQVGAATVTSDPAAASDPAFFTLPHPALTRWTPRIVTDAATGKKVPVEDQNGDMVFDKKPIYIAKAFEGPLKAVLSSPDPKAWRALMTLKSKAIGAIMYNPLVHNQVIYGKAFPYMVKHDPIGAFTGKLYRDGFNVKNDEELMQRALSAGLAPINSRWLTTDVGAIDRDNVEPGHGWTSQLAGAAAKLMNKGWEMPTKEAVDKFHDFLSNRLLWDQIASLQAGIWKTMSDHYQKHGFDQDTADQIAAHFANLYAGSVPKEAMSKLARGILNGVLFSRSFHATNIGGLKAIIAGLPTDVQAQIRLDKGQEVLTQAQGATRGQAASTVFLDILSAWAFRAMAAGALGYLMHKTIAWPQDNEKGKQSKLLVGHEPDGTAIYLNVPFGKYADEITEWGSEPLTYAKRIMFGPTRLAVQLPTNDAGFGKKIYDPYDKSLLGLGKNAWRVLGSFVETVMPMGTLKAIADMATSKGQEQKDAAGAMAGQLTGFTVSHGAPGGEAMGDYFDAKSEHEFRVNEAMPDIRKQIKRGDVPGARKAMTELGIPPKLQNFYVRTAINPAARLSPRKMGDFRRYATPEQKAALARDLAARQSDAAQ